MMGGGAFDLLKTGRRRPESTKQAQVRLAILLKILQIFPRPEAKPSSEVSRRRAKVVFSINSA
jgi:hypothetical protein